MWFLFRKEITDFFSSVSGYLVLVVFLIFNGLFLWVLPGVMNIPEGGVASAEGFFRVTPWLFLFLIPAITMRSFAEEKQNQTLSLLLTRPLPRASIVGAKFLASWGVVFFALVPCGVFFVSLWILGNPSGNLDAGAILGAFLGVLFLGGLLVSVGIFASSATSGSVVSFIVALVVGFFLWQGFDLLASLPYMNPVAPGLLVWGIPDHYASISRGVIDIKDVFYFVGAAFFFLLLTTLRLDAQKSLRYKLFLSGLCLVVLALGITVSGRLFLRLDVTGDRRYSLSDDSRRFLRQMQQPVSFTVYLDGDLPVQMKRLRSGVEHMMDECRILSGNKLIFRLVDPLTEVAPSARDAYFESLANKGLSIVDLRVKERNGSLKQMLIVPGALARSGDAEMAVNFLQNNPAYSDAVNLERSMVNLEYEILKTLRCLQADTVEKIVFLEGHGELSEVQTASVSRDLSQFFQVDRGIIGGHLGALDPYKAVIIAGPSLPFSEQDKYIIDQYIMRGGRVVWLVDGTRVLSDSLTSGYTLGLSDPLGIEDQLFIYGVRVNPDVIQDRNCHLIPVNMGSQGGQTRWETLPWLYYPLLIPPQNHTVTASLNLIWMRFASSIDTVNSRSGIKKTPLLMTSGLSRSLQAPVMIRMDEVGEVLPDKVFNHPGLIVALLLDGRFPSAFRNRMADGLFPGLKLKTLSISDSTRMLVISDPDLIRNEVTEGPEGPVPARQPLGFDRYTGTSFGNADFFVNALNYLTGHEDLMRLRSKDVVLRLFDRDRFERDRWFWLLVNVVFPSLLVGFLGTCFLCFRRWRYTRS